jgi:UDP-N-acetylmuramoyl-tripeptide--D-alanyl-D-alanine ligase
MRTLLLLAAGLVWMLAGIRPALVGFRILQIEEYEIPRLFRWAGRRSTLVPPLSAGLGAGALVLGYLLAALGGIDGVVALGIGWLAASLAFLALWRPLPAKKPLVRTARMRRMAGGGVVVGAVVALSIAILLTNASAIVAAIVVAVALAALPAVAIAVVAAATIVTQPLELYVQQFYLRQAKARMAEVRPLVVAVAGSFGKTTTKSLIAECLSGYRPTLATPKSFNTLMGITRAINEGLEPQHRMFVVEMDAYEQGEIARLTGLTPPSVSVVTAVGPQHLERFKRMEAIEDAIYEVIQALPPDGTAVVYVGDPVTALVADRARAEGRRTVSYALEGESVGADVIAGQVAATDDGHDFVWRWEAEELSQRVHLPLYGIHNIANATAALAVARILGADVAQSAFALGRVAPVEHRLFPIRAQGDVLIIDDSYNANPVGVRNALATIAAMPRTPKILVTPGIVELGSVEEVENRRVGEYAAQVCDWVLLVESETSKSVLAGLRQAGFDSERVKVLPSLGEVNVQLRTITRPGAVVLFCNDLPDPYILGR